VILAIELAGCVPAPAGSPISHDGRLASAKLAGMSMFDALSLLIVVAAGFSFVNHRFLRLPTTIGVTLLVLAGSHTIQTMTYVVAVFSIVVQGLSFKRLLPRVASALAA